MRLDLFRCVSWATIVSGFFLSLYVGFVLTYPFKVSESKFKVLSPVIKPGENLVLQVNYCKWMDLPAISTRQLNDGVVIELPPSSTNLPKGCGSVVRYVPIPTSVPDGKYSYQTTLEYKLSVLRTIMVTTTSPEFHVKR